MKIDIFQILINLGFDASIYSSHYRFLSCYYKVKVSATDFYKNTLLYLVYTPLDQIPIDDQRAIGIFLKLIQFFFKKLIFINYQSI